MSKISVHTPLARNVLSRGVSESLLGPRVAGIGSGSDVDCAAAWWWRIQTHFESF